jgi:hypothetical protein
MHFPKLCHANNCNNWESGVLARLSCCLTTSEYMWRFGVGTESSKERERVRDRERTWFQVSNDRFVPSSVVNSKSSIRICWANVVVVFDTDINNNNQRAAVVVKVVNRLIIPIADGAGKNNNMHSTEVVFVICCCGMDQMWTRSKPSASVCVNARKDRLV